MLTIFSMMYEYRKAVEMLADGASVKDVREKIKLTVSQIYQIKRKAKPMDFGCIVCCSKRYPNSKFCTKHTKRYGWNH